MSEYGYALLMVPTHQQLIGLLVHADPGFVAGTFATRFRSALEAEGETGSFRYFPGGFWEVIIGDAGRFLLAPWGLRVELESGLVEEVSGRRRPPRFPPWSLVLPRYSSFLGREGDDWQLDARRPLVEEPGVLTAALTNLEDPEYTGILIVSTETYTITSADLGHMVQTLEIVRSEPNDEDLAALDEIKASVPGVPDGR